MFLCVFAWEGCWRTLPPVGGYLLFVDFVAFRGYIDLLDLLVFGFYSKSLKVGSLDRLVGCPWLWLWIRSTRPVLFEASSSRRGISNSLTLVASLLNFSLAVCGTWGTILSWYSFWSSIAALKGISLSARDACDLPDLIWYSESFATEAEESRILCLRWLACEWWCLYYFSSNCSFSFRDS